MPSGHTSDLYEGREQTFTEFALQQEAEASYQADLVRWKDAEKEKRECVEVVDDVVVPA